MKIPSEMPHLTTLHCQENLDLNGRMFWREAVRAVVWREDKLLMVHSALNSDYKFPGGGVEPGEQHAAALARELREESEAELLEVLGNFGKVLEYDHAIEDDYDIFAMNSYYYLCRVGDEIAFEQEYLDDYERKLGFRPVWINPREALHHNLELLQNNSLNLPRWIHREIFVLEELVAGLRR